MADVLRIFLTSEQITVMGAATTKAFYETVPKDLELMRRFSPIFVSPLSFENNILVLHNFCDGFVPDSLL